MIIFLLYSILTNGGWIKYEEAMKFTAYWRILTRLLKLIYNLSDLYASQKLISNTLLVFYKIKSPVS